MAEFLNRTGGDGGGSPGRRERGRMRRRLRRQQRVREALLLDLGALVYELHGQGRREPELLQAKAAELSAVDDEVRALGEALDEHEPMAQLVAAGIAGSCDNCGALLTSDARFCSACGTPTSPALAGEPPPAPEPRSEPPAQTGTWTDDVGVPGREVPPPRPTPPAPSYEPTVDRAVRAAQ